MTSCCVHIHMSRGVMDVVSAIAAPSSARASFVCCWVVERSSVLVVALFAEGCVLFSTAATGGPSLGPWLAAVNADHAGEVPPPLDVGPATGAAASTWSSPKPVPVLAARRSESREEGNTRAPEAAAAAAVLSYGARGFLARPAQQVQFMGECERSLWWCAVARWDENECFWEGRCCERLWACGRLRVGPLEVCVRLRPLPSLWDLNPIR